jgi:serine phosphatase RsbU (regulator of sigma subunit)
LIAGLILSLIIIAGAFIGYRNKKRANALLQMQKKEIENQKNYLTSSINYAKRIQSAVFPSDNVLASRFSEHFILFKPLDVVSGDFYWYRQNRDEVYIAVADCTGHGVPGAFMSILGITYLNEIVNKTESGNPAEILYHLRENVIRSLNQSNQISEVKDGMEVALCKLNMESRMLQFSGAFRPLFLIRENAIHYFKGDKMPIGVYDNIEKPFANNNIQLQKDDVVYIFTDGFVDQIGGPDRKTFKTNRFKELLLDISRYPMPEQKYLLERRIVEWQGEFDQTDDILVVGFKITD